MPGRHDRPGRAEKAMSRTSATHVHGESDGRVLCAGQRRVQVG
jgi:hypothetical protein